MRAAQPGYHVTSHWLPGHLQRLPNRTMGVSWSQSTEDLVAAASLGLLEKSVRPHPCECCRGGSCLLEVGHSCRGSTGSPLEMAKERLRAGTQEPS